MILISPKQNTEEKSLISELHVPASNKALIIFTRNPELGKCKTRLAKTIGDQAALEVYKYLLNHTSKIALNVNADKYVFYSENINNNDMWPNQHFNKYLQHGCDLGEKMYHAFTQLFKLNYANIIIIGSDLLDLNTEIIERAFAKLNTNDIVIGPATDGGYYLLGMKKMHALIFCNKAWGTNTVRQDTLKDLKEMQIFLTKELNDIDTFEDMQPYQELQKFLK